ncbi:MAG: hypothetical protein OEW77_10250, partial [Gemmatimonadota bacterium]|nr:hypothetical protein [Gemmatimonadota bacterium]
LDGRTGGTAGGCETGELTGVTSPSDCDGATGVSPDGRGMREMTPGVKVGVGFRRGGGEANGTL